MKLFAVIALLLTLVTACSRRQETVEHRYTLNGKVMALSPQDQTATIDAAAIPNFMEAMTMEYPVRSRQDFNLLHVGDRITATVNVLPEGLYYLSDIKVQKPR